jgi:hypothetical protein
LQVTAEPHLPHTFWVVGVALALDHVTVGALIATLWLRELLRHHRSLIAFALGRSLTLRLAGKRAFRGFWDRPILAYLLGI